MNKHAYLIMAHKNIKQIQLLINSIDFEYNDIYVFLDSKSKIDRTLLSSKISKLFFVKSIDVRWGSGSVIDAEMSLFKSAYDNHCKYDYYHLISGQDYPLAPQNEIHRFFDENPKKEFITFSEVANQKDLSTRLHSYYFSRHFRTNNLFFKIVHKIQKKFFELLFMISLENREKIYFGSNWCSIDDEFVKYLIDHEKYISKTFGKGFLVDELYKHHMIMKSEYFKNKIYHREGIHDLPEEFQGNLRYINWWDGSPYTWTKKDFVSLKNAKRNGHFFARKFDINVDDEIIGLINDKLINYNDDNNK